MIRRSETSLWSFSFTTFHLVVPFFFFVSFRNDVLDPGAEVVVNAQF